ncbi:protein FAR1-RELATED SEQUENCE 5-like [Dendrobium catenatum]|uniref:Protein FAR1-RELATED SEQUENCE 5 n=1 Tax=Dendrobium catenatum TaxID=906689 RepID=A0A2I0WPM9_9ASPA|nr:protein FAR1-RELATED SEQUENCE 5-like [Dendrobium catenatum]PKU77617.1 Protein FAR1-RELATED SEQUENCE 5 [Dendrobium catenatum]
MVRFSVSEEGIWTAKNSVETHNHELAKPDDQHLLRSSGHITEENTSVLKSMADAGIRTINAFSYLSEEVGGVENLGFTKRDAYNYIKKEIRAKIENGDSNSLIELFKNRSAEDNLFAWDVQTDDKERLVNFFWVDDLGRVDYDCFGDIIIFDTSYRLNKYNLVCAPIIGVNNHWQNIILGMTFLSDETIDSFCWLFQTFLRIMDNKHPVTIFTDQDQAMARAIEIVFPNTRHRLCQWHIHKKAPSKVWCFNSNNKVKGLFYSCFNKCDSAEEFDSLWNEMISEGDLHSHQWLNDLYKIWERWSTAFNKDCFNLGILSTQRSESTNFVCHGISKATSSLTECFLGLEKLINSWRRNERDEFFRCSQTKIQPYMKRSPILKKAAKFYSRKLYSFFEEEFLNGLGGLRIDHSSPDSSTFPVQNIDHTFDSHKWTVLFSSSEGIIKCSCRKFEMMGILCSHCMRVMSQLDVTNISQKYLIPRWSATARNDLYSGLNVQRMAKSLCTLNQGSRNMIFRNYVYRFAYQISTEAQGNEDAEQCMIDGMSALALNVQNIMEGKRNKCITEGIHKSIRDPAKRRPKGVSNARLKDHWEKRKAKKVKPTVHNPNPTLYFTPAELGSQSSFM